MATVGRSDDLRAAEFIDADLRGARFVDAELNRPFPGRFRLFGLVNVQVAPAASAGWPTSASSSCAATPFLVYAATTISIRLRPW
jgi:hypothetical protein